MASVEPVVTPEWTHLEAFLAEAPIDALVGQRDVRPQADLYRDLDMDHEDIARFLALWAERFSIDMSEFDFDAYYPAAKLTTPAYFGMVMKASFSRNARACLGGRPLTLGALESAMRAQRWNH
ncbi:DUF1493 family protein [Paraburkholderia acidisoli]|uniref:DUF1493 family protein n=1 Tax=Paraburkholderia acidisoli TaxID=2571748 RepID=A0A7Z2JJ50_9BURK|nr:DUF1493 family protein [Paraburkholderia acidisoli]QGZ65843.1 DUF1493 family protein [Paraburkholderia acidisoli]